VFGCDLRPSARHDFYAATLFRLPLRTRAQAQRSEICQKHYDDAEMRLLTSDLAAEFDAFWPAFRSRFWYKVPSVYCLLSFRNACIVAKQYVVGARDSIVG